MNIRLFQYAVWLSTWSTHILYALTANPQLLRKSRFSFERPAHAMLAPLSSSTETLGDLRRKGPKQSTAGASAYYQHQEDRVKEHEEKDKTLLTTVLDSKTLWPRYLYDYYEHYDDAAFEERRAKETEQLVRTLYLVVIDGGSTKTNADLWSTTVIHKAGQEPIVKWSSIKILSNLGKIQDLRSFHNQLRSLDSDSAIVDVTASFLAPIFNNAQSVLKNIIAKGFDPHLMMPSIPVVVHSTAGLRDLDDASRKRLFRAIELAVNGETEIKDRYNELFLNGADAVTASNQHTNYRTPLKTRIELSAGGNKKQVFSFFTTPRYCRGITGIEEAIFTFMTANIATGVIQSMRKDTREKRRLGGILEVGGASMQVVFSVEKTVMDGTLETSDLMKDNRFLRKDLFPSDFEEFNVFGTSYMNLGNNRALALLLKQHCQKNSSPEGKCYSPCFHRGWKQTCVPGVPRIRKKRAAGESPVEIDAEGRVIMDGNYLLEVARFCHKGNPLLKNITPRSNCLRSGFTLNSTDVEEEAKIHGCIEIEGTGNVSECHALITDLLFSNELPGNQESLAETGTASPVEVGQFMNPKGILYVVGNSLVIPIGKLKKWRMLHSAYYNTGSNNIRRCDLTYLEDAAQLLCSMELAKDHTFVNPITLKLLQIDHGNYDYCYRTVYALALFKALNVKIGDVQVQFETKIRHVENDEVLDFGWTYGALANLMLKSDFTLDLFGLGPKFYRSSYRQEVNMSNSLINPNDTNEAQPMRVSRLNAEFQATA